MGRRDGMRVACLACMCTGASHPGARRRPRTDRIVASALPGVLRLCPCPVQPAPADAATVYSADFIKRRFLVFFSIVIG